MKRRQDDINNQQEVRDMRLRLATERNQRLDTIRTAVKELQKKIPDDLIPNILSQIYDQDDLWTVLLEFGIVR